MSLFLVPFPKCAAFRSWVVLGPPRVIFKISSEWMTHEIQISFLTLYRQSQALWILRIVWGFPVISIVIIPLRHKFVILFIPEVMISVMVNSLVWVFQECYLWTCLGNYFLAIYSKKYLWNFVCLLVTEFVESLITTTSQNYIFSNSLYYKIFSYCPCYDLLQNSWYLLSYNNLIKWKLPVLFLESQMFPTYNSIFI